MIFLNISQHISNLFQRMKSNYCFSLNLHIHLYSISDGTVINNALKKSLVLDLVEVDFGFLGNQGKTSTPL